MSKQNENNNKSKNRKKQIAKEEYIKKGLKNSVGFAWSLLVNVIIVFLVIKLFAFSFNFAYSVFGNVAKTPGSTEYIVVELPSDASTMEIATTLEEIGVIEDKYVFAVKVRVKEYGSKIVSGKYGLSPSMTYDEILSAICQEDEDDEEKE